MSLKCSLQGLAGDAERRKGGAAIDDSNRDCRYFHLGKKLKQRLTHLLINSCSNMYSLGQFSQPQTLIQLKQTYKYIRSELQLQIEKSTYKVGIPYSLIPTFIV